MGSTYQLFQQAERVEATAAAIYAALGKAFHADPVAKTLFVRLQAEEEQHAARVRLLAAHYRVDPKLPVDASFPALDACLADAHQALVEVEAGQWGLELAQVRRRLLALEERLGAAHAEIMAAGASPKVRDFFGALADQDAAHAKLLQA